MKIITKRIPSGKGTIEISIHTPCSIKNKLAILCPGFVDSKDYADLVSLADNLCRKEYLVVRFDPTGTWNSGDDIEHYTISQYLIDIKSVLEYMLQQQRFKDILIGGRSKGGEVAVLYAARDSRITKVLAVLPPVNILKLKSSKYLAWKNNGFRITKRDIPNNPSRIIPIKIPINYLDDLAKYDSLTEIKNVKVPIIFVAGEKDTSVPPEEVRILFEHANEPKKFILVKGINHDYRQNPKYIASVNNSIMKEMD
jgi:pimeloyl-ACP methyl ester carboxylesterase